MKSEYVHFFSGSLIETNYITTKLSEHRLKYIVRDEQKSANLAGFGIPNYLFSVSYTHLTLPTKRIV